MGVVVGVYVVVGVAGAVDCFFYRVAGVVDDESGGERKGLALVGGGARRCWGEGRVVLAIVSKAAGRSEVGTLDLH